MHGQTDPRKYLLIAGILQIVWGFDPAASKYVIDEIPVEFYIALRWTISGVIFALFLAATGQWRRVATRDLFAVAGLGILGYTVVHPQVVERPGDIRQVGLRIGLGQLPQDGQYFLIGLLVLSIGITEWTQTAPSNGFRQGEGVTPLEVNMLVDQR